VGSGLRDGTPRVVLEFTSLMGEVQHVQNHDGNIKSLPFPKWIAESKTESSLSLLGFS